MLSRCGFPCESTPGMNIIPAVQKLKVTMTKISGARIRRMIRKITSVVGTVEGMSIGVRCAARRRAQRCNT